MDSLGQLSEICRQNGLALTHQRRVIYEILLATPGHPSPEEIYGSVRKKIPSISLNTVYNNIRVFLEKGMLREVSVHHGTMRVETNSHPHHHFVCVSCRSIEDIEQEVFEPVRVKEFAPPGFKVHRYSIDVIGQCANCAGAGI